jgi:hypothetical protein
MWHQCLIDLDGSYLVGAFWFLPILKIGPIPTRAGVCINCLTNSAKWEGNVPENSGKLVI